MDTLIVVTVAVLGLTGIVLQAKSAGRFVHFFNLLVFSALWMVLLPSVGETSHAMMYALPGIAALNFAASQVTFLRKEYVRVLVPLVSMGAYLLLFKDGALELFGEKYVSVNKFLVGGTMIAVLAYEMGLVKTKVLKKLLDGIDHSEVMTSILLLLMAVALFMGSLASSSFGLLVVATAFLSSGFYRNDDSHKISLSLLMFTTIPVVLKLANEETSTLVDGDVLQGLFVGAFGMYFIQKLWDATKRNSIAIALGYILVLGVAFAILWSGTMFYKMGGMDALVGVIVGLALINAVLGKGFVGSSIFMLLLAGALSIPSLMVNEEQAAFEQQTMITTEGGVDENGNEVPPPTILPLEDFKGVNAIISDSSSVKFFLGEGGKTKGAFKKVKGTISINEDMSLSSLDIILPMSEFTTFMGTRDQSLRGDDYFKVDKFPVMRYKAKGFTKTAENVYKVNGDFSMLGVTKKVEVTLQRIELGDKKIIIGSGEIDRTLFGMTPDASEGNVVGFNYQVELR